MAFKWRIWALAALLAALSATSPLHAGLWDSIKGKILNEEKVEPPTIKVLVLHDKDAVVVEVKGKYSIYDPLTNARVGSYYVSKSNLVQPLTSGLKWGEEYPGIFQIEIVPQNNNTTIVVDGIEYKGSVYIYDIGGSISVVNEVDVEDYVSSLLGLTITKLYHDEALAAAAIATRTQAYHDAQNTQNPYWHVDAKQVNYQGHAVTSRFKAVDQAIDATRYMAISHAGTENGTVNPVQAKITDSGKSSPGTLSLDDANAQAEKGDHAAKILSRAFPNTNIGLMYKS